MQSQIQASVKELEQPVFLDCCVQVVAVVGDSASAGCFTFQRGKSGDRVAPGPPECHHQFLQLFQESDPSDCTGAAEGLGLDYQQSNSYLTIISVRAKVAQRC